MNLPLTISVEYCENCGRKKGLHRAIDNACPEKRTGRIGKYPKYTRDRFKLGKVKNKTIRR